MPDEPVCFSVRLNCRYFDGLNLPDKEIRKFCSRISKLPPDSPLHDPYESELVGQSGELAYLVPASTRPGQFSLVIEFPLGLPSRHHRAWDAVVARWFESRTAVAEELIPLRPRKSLSGSQAERIKGGRYHSIKIGMGDPGGRKKWRRLSFYEYRFGTFSQTKARASVSERNRLIYQWNDLLKRRGLTKKQRAEAILVGLEKYRVGSFLVNTQDVSVHELKHSIFREAKKVGVVRSSPGKAGAPDRTPPQAGRHPAPPDEFGASDTGSEGLHARRSSRDWFFPDMLPRIREWVQSTPRRKSSHLARLVHQFDERAARFHLSHVLPKHDPYQPNTSTIWRLISSKRNRA